MIDILHWWPPSCSYVGNPFQFGLPCTHAPSSLTLFQELDFSDYFFQLCLTVFEWYVLLIYLLEMTTYLFLPLASLLQHMNFYNCTARISTSPRNPPKTGKQYRVLGPVTEKLLTLEKILHSRTFRNPPYHSTWTLWKALILNSTSRATSITKARSKPSWSQQPPLLPRIPVPAHTIILLFFMQSPYYRRIKPNTEVDSFEKSEEWFLPQGSEFRHASATHMHYFIWITVQLS